MTVSGYYIVIDFDGTVVKHRYPAIGEDIGALPVLRKLIKNGHQLVLSTMRSHDTGSGDTLQPAIDWFKEREIPLYGINENPSQKEWTTSAKIFGHIYIDDAALGAPLKTDPGDAVPYYDWSIASVYLYYHGFLTDQDIIDLVQDGTISPEHITIKEQ